MPGPNLWYTLVVVIVFVCHTGCCRALQCRSGRAKFAGRSSPWKSGIMVQTDSETVTRGQDRETCVCVGESERGGQTERQGQISHFEFHALSVSMSRSTNFQCHKSVERAGKNGLCVASWVIAAFLMSYFWFVCAGRESTCSQMSQNCL